MHKFDTILGDTLIGAIFIDADFTKWVLALHDFCTVLHDSTRGVIYTVLDSSGVHIKFLTLYTSYLRCIAWVFKIFILSKIS